MFSISSWDGLAKLGTYEVSSRVLQTPNLFPVVDPRQNQIPIQAFKDTFGFDQVITSAYLMSKRYGHYQFEEYEKVHQYLDFDGMIMMDSGAYQVMLYGDIELGVSETIQLQHQVEPDIGVIMDHPIGYDVSYQEAKRRVENTLVNVKQSLPMLESSTINWTLPIQGGRHLDLLHDYIRRIHQSDLIEPFKFYALGSVVPVMINQDYSTLVRMIAITRKELPITSPLHLFGAGHPAMFALATFLGCDTFDSAAYALMAKDNRYMTIEGTTHLSDITEFPCICEVCAKYSPQELAEIDRDERISLLSQHNLWVSVQELHNIREAIRSNTLWDLVNLRSTAVPNLRRATNLARKMVLDGDLVQLFTSGTPQSEFGSTRIITKTDMKKVNITRIKKRIRKYLLGNTREKMVIVGLDMKETIYKKIPDKEIENFDFDKNMLLLLLPPFGLVPIGMSEVFPIGQLLHELEVDDFDFNQVYELIRELRQSGLRQCDLIIPKDWPEIFVSNFSSLIETTITYTESPVGALREIIKSFID